MLFAIYWWSALARETGRLLTTLSKKNKNALITLRLFVKKKSVFLRVSHIEEDRQVGRNIGGLENVSYLRLCLIYCFMKKTSTHIGCLWEFIYIYSRVFIGFQNSEYSWIFTFLQTERKMARLFAKVSEEEIRTAFSYPSDLVYTKTTNPLRVGEERWIHTSTLRVSVYIHHYSPHTYL